MATNNLVKTKGLVLRAIRYKEASKILDIFTEERGRINLFASGVMRKHSGLMLNSEKFAESNFILNQNNSAYYLNSADLINSNLELGSDPKKYFLGEFICEIILKTMPENLVDSNIYKLIEKTFENLRKENVDLGLLKLGFMIKYISLIGFRPNFGPCSHCGSEDFSNIYFSYQHGGHICGTCIGTIEACAKLDKLETSILVKLLYTKYSDYDELEISPKTIEKLDEILYNYLIYNTEIEVLESQKKYMKVFEI